MGSSNSKSNSKSSIEYDELVYRIMKLEKNEDAHNNQNREYKKKISELNKQIDTLKYMNSSLTDKTINDSSDLSGVSNNMDLRENKLQLNELSKKRINAFVENMLNDKHVNIKYLPDFVEKQIYRNVFSLFMNVLDNILETTNLQFMGHSVTFDIKPNNNENNNN